MTLSAISSVVKIPVLSMMEETVNRISARQSPIGLLATRATIRTKVYENGFAKKQISVILPDDADQEILTEVIMRVLSHGGKESAKAKLRKVVQNLKARGARAIVLACTELPLIVEPDYGLEVVDPTEILARSCVALATS